MWCFCGTMENAYLPTFARMDGWMEHYLGGEQTVQLLSCGIQLEGGDDSPLCRCLLAFLEQVH